MRKKNCQNVLIDGQALTRMKKLRILKIWQPFAVTLFSGRLDLLFNKLRLLYWHGLPLKFLPSDFYPENIVSIDLSYSHIKHLWTTPKCFMRLKFMKLRHCCSLTTTPDFSEITNLEELDLEGCVNLVTVHPSIVMLKRLVVLNMSDCRRAMSCLNVNQVPEAFWSRWWTSIPGFIWKQKHPERSVSLAGLRMLKSLNLSYCNLEQVPESIGGLLCLKYLYLSGNNFTSLPGSLTQLSHLSSLFVSGCKKLEVLPNFPPSLHWLNAGDCTSLCSITGTSLISILNNCPKLFTNLAIDSQLTISGTQPLDSSITSLGSKSKFSSFRQNAGIQNNECQLYRFPGSSIESMNIIYPGNSIQEYWFTYKSMGNNVKVELPSDWCYDKFRGFGTCVVFKRKISCESIGYSIKNFDGSSVGGCYERKCFQGKPIRINEPYMVWLHYTWNTSEWKEAKNVVTFCFDEDNDYEVKEFGARLICDEDLEQDVTNSIITWWGHECAYASWLPKRL